MNTKHCILLFVSAVFAQYAPPEVYPPAGQYPPPGPYPPAGQYPPQPYERPTLPVLMSNLVDALVDSSQDKPEFYKYFSKYFVCRVNGVVSNQSAEQCRHLRNPEKFVHRLKDVKNPVDYLNGHGFTFEANSFNGHTIFVTVLAQKDIFKIVSFDEFKYFDHFGGY